jgi:hypothetical protein
MAIIQISKIQQRAGNLVDLPQLDEAQLGWANDAKRLFIGTTTPNPNENVEVLTSYSDITFSQINGSEGNLSIISAASGQVLGYNGTNWVNKGGAAGGLINLGDVANVKISGGVNGYVLQTDGLGNLSWTTQTGGGGAGVPGGAVGQLQFNLDGTAFGGNSGLTFNQVTNEVAVPAVLAAGGNITSAGTITGTRLISNIATGTAPLVVSSTTQVANLNVASAGLATFATTANAVAGANVSGAVSFATTANAVAGANVSGAVSFATTANAVAGANVSGAVSFATTANAVAGANVSGQVANALVAGTVYTAAQPNITSTGTLTSVSVSGNVSTTGIKTDNYYYANGIPISFAGAYSNSNVASYLPTFTGTVGATGLTTGSISTSGTITGNWGLSGGSKLSATYADLAEYYESDKPYEPGTVLEFGGSKEVTIAENCTTRVAGVVSTDPAYVMNSQCKGNYVVALALQGRVPCKIRGKIRKGDMLVSAGEGYARSMDHPYIGSVIGKSLENFDDAEGIIEIAVGRL